MPNSSSWRPDPAYSIACKIRGRERVDFTHHADERMRERHVTSQHVIDAVRSPDEESLPVDQFGGENDPPRYRVRKMVGTGLALDVVFEDWDDAIVIISVYPRRSRLSGRF